MEAMTTTRRGMSAMSRRLYLVGVTAVLATLLITPPVYRLHSGTVTYLAYEPDGRARFTRVVGPKAEEVDGEPWTDDSEVSPACRAALIASEDAKFRRHHGLDRNAIEVALLRNLSHRRIVWGGSTITQQVVKNVFLGREKSFARKLREAAGALLLDRIMAKDRQLTWYLNVAEFGPRVYGVEQAARRFFGRHARELGLADCVSLFAVLPDPVRSHAALFARPPPARFAARRERTLRVLELTAALPPPVIASARAELARGRAWRSRAQR